MQLGLFSARTFSNLPPRSPVFPLWQTAQVVRGVSRSGLMGAKNLWQDEQDISPALFDGKPPMAFTRCTCRAWNSALRRTSSGSRVEPIGTRLLLMLATIFCISADFCCHS